VINATKKYQRDDLLNFFAIHEAQNANNAIMLEILFDNRLMSQ